MSRRPSIIAGTLGFGVVALLALGASYAIARAERGVEVDSHEADRAHAGDGSDAAPSRRHDEVPVAPPAAESKPTKPDVRDQPRGSYVLMAVPRAAAGMRCPDGSYLPPLNGVTVDDPIPAIQRDDFMPPIGPIVGRYVDDAGHAWWMTSDGSAFTTRWQTLRLGDGSVQRVVRLDQADALGAAGAKFERRFESGPAADSTLTTR